MPPLPPLLIYDGACAFCRRWVARWEERTRGRVRFLPAQAVRLRKLGLRRAGVRRAVWLIEPGGRRTRGSEAVFRALRFSPEPTTRWRARLGLLPGVLQLSQRVYAAIARRRMRAARFDRLLFGRAPAVARSDELRTLALQSLGGIFFSAFTSLARQVPGLWGRRGILPAEETQALLAERWPTRRAQLQHVPSVFWFTGAEEDTLVRAARAGQLASLLLLSGVLPLPALAVATALYLSFLGIGRDFLSFQWDSLLVETGMHALLIAPWSLSLARRRRPPAGLAVLAQRLLLLRLNFGSGIGKLQSGDPSWRDGTALATHHETTPLPTPLGWYAHQWPARIHRASTVATLAMELVPPFLVFGPRRVRALAFWLLNGLQTGIGLTGNYGFFNPLSSQLTLWALDDAMLPDLARSSAAARRALKPRSNVGELFANALALPFIALSLRELLARFDRSPERLDRFARHARPWMLGSSYALFTSMTLQRPEVEVEGSNDGAHWKPYPFRYKAGRLASRPGWVAPHMPRLDWQMWFAALSRPPQWFVAFLGRLLEGAPEVLALLAADPFAAAPPRYVRATLYRYHMTSREERRRSGCWWKRERLGLYVPPLTRGPEGLQLAPDATWLEHV